MSQATPHASGNRDGQGHAPRRDTLRPSISLISPSVLLSVSASHTHPFSITSSLCHAIALSLFLFPSLLISLHSFICLSIFLSILRPLFFLLCYFFFPFLYFFLSFSLSLSNAHTSPSRIYFSTSLFFCPSTSFFSLAGPLSLHFFLSISVTCASSPSIYLSLRPPPSCFSVPLYFSFFPCSSHNHSQSLSSFS